MRKKLFSLPVIAIVASFFSLTASAQDIFQLKANGKVVIGDTNQISTPGPYQLYVQNGILTERVKVALRDDAEWSDDAWERLPSLNEVRNSIDQNRHLVDMPSAGELVRDGYELKDMDAKLLQQIEWIWLYVLELEKKNAALEQELAKLRDPERN